MLFRSIPIILWLIENVISSECLNSFRYDYKYDTDKILSQKEIGMYPQEFYSLIQPFYNNHFYDETYIPMIFTTFRNKQFNFSNISNTCSKSLIVSALINWDIYSLREFHLENCEFDEKCYSQLMSMVRCNLGKLVDESADFTEPEGYYDGTWSNGENILYRQIGRAHV